MPSAMLKIGLASVSAQIALAQIVPADVLFQHNVYRCMHSADPMTYSSNLADGALEHADFLAATCDSLEHDDSFDEGENLYYCDTSSASRLPTCQSGFDAIIDWYEEVSDYDQDDPPFYTTGGQIGHFTQVVWKSSEELGCATSDCSYQASSATYLRTYTVCRYSPAGNFQSQSQHRGNVQPSASKTEATCESELTSGTVATPAPVMTPAPVPSSEETPAPIDVVSGLADDEAEGAVLLGCFVRDDSSYTRARGNRGQGSGGMDAEVCAGRCEGYAYFGTGPGRGSSQSACYCGNEALIDSADNCDSPCSGNSAVACGGEFSLSLFMFDVSMTPAPVTPAPVDVIVTPAPVDVIVTPAPVDMIVTPAPVDVIVTPAPVDVIVTPAPVDMIVTPAPVDVIVTPAPVDMIVTPAPVDMIVTPAPVDMIVTPAPVDVTLENDEASGATLVGCFVDDGTYSARGRRWGSRLRRNMDAEVCADICDGYDYFGTGGGRGCYCGNEPLTDSADNCDEPCRGNSAVACGGEGSLSVFMFDVPMTPAPVAVTPAPVDVTLENDEADGTTLIGCFVDDGTYNTRGRRWGSRLRRNMDAEVCANICDGYDYFGTGGGRGCYCGNEPLTDSADNCDEPCRGNSAVACGGEGSLSVFMFDVPMTPAPVAVTPAPVDVTLENDEADGTTLIGCFVDDGTYNTRGRRWGSRLRRNMDAEVCADICDGYDYFGTGGGRGCYCGNEPLTDSADNCDEPCRGNSAVACGGEGSLSVFMFDVPMTPAPVAVTPAPVDVTLENDEADGAILVGCFVDDGTYSARGGRRGSRLRRNMDAEVCAGFCEDYDYFGTGYGRGCHCGDEPLTESADNCDTPCSGNSAVACGGDGSLSVFMFDAPVTPAPALGIDEADGATFLGCFEDNGRHRVLDARMKSNENHMDAEHCFDFCSDFKFFGTESSEECFCGDYEPTKLATNCDAACSGNEAVICGGHNAISVFSNDALAGTTPERPTRPTLGEDSVAGAKPLGCFEDDRFDRVLDAKMEVDDDEMDAEASTEAISQRALMDGYLKTYFDILPKLIPAPWRSTYSTVAASIFSDAPSPSPRTFTECFCGDIAPTDLADNCDYPCAGNEEVACGGWNAISVFKRARGRGRHDGRNDDLKSLGCLEDSRANRIMSRGPIERDNMTPEVCLDICSDDDDGGRRGRRAEYFGVQFANECFCTNNDDFFGEAIVSDSCDMECDGDSSIICGGVDAMNVYAIPE